jgi:hydrogenase expression/formation protein HypC
MCLGIPGQIVAFVDETGHLAKVDVSGVRRTINVGLVLPDGLEVGEWVQIHVGFALSKINEQEARRTLEFFAQLDSGFDQELEAFKGSEVTT